MGPFLRKGKIGATRCLINLEIILLPLSMGGCCDNNAHVQGNQLRGEFDAMSPFGLYPVRGRRWLGLARAAAAANHSGTNIPVLVGAGFGVGAAGLGAVTRLVDGPDSAAGAESGLLARVRLERS